MSNMSYSNLGQSPQFNHINQSANQSESSGVNPFQSNQFFAPQNVGGSQSSRGTLNASLFQNQFQPLKNNQHQNNFGGYPDMIQPKNYGAIPSSTRNIFEKDFVQCKCGSEVSKKEVQHHIKSCPLMSQQYDKFWGMLESEYRECQSHQDYKNLKCLVGAFTDKLNDTINNGNNTPSQQHPNHIFQECFQNGSNVLPQIMSYSNKMNQSHIIPNNRQPMNFNNNKVLGPAQHTTFNNKLPEQFKPSLKKPVKLVSDDFLIQHMADEEEKTQPSHTSKSNNIDPAWKEELKEPEPQVEVNSDICSKCNQLITLEEQEVGDKVMLIETNCFHTVHRKCLIDHAYEHYPKTQNAPCPFHSCQQTIPEYEIKQYLTTQQKQELEKIIEKSILDDSGNVVQCNRCKNFMELEQGKVDYQQKDENGKPISRDAAIHMSKYRVRCQSCSLIFCASCKEEPYHLGTNCEQFKHFKQARKCRFCQEQIYGSSPSDKPAFKDVCNNQECIDLMNQSCDKVLPCGHSCNGFAGEPECMPCLQDECVAKHQLTRDVGADEYCAICYTQGLGEKPCIQLECKHIFHLDCILNRLKKKWPGPRMVFNFLDCTQCKRRIRAAYCHQVSIEMAEAEAVESDVRKKALERAKHEGLDKNERLKLPPYSGNLLTYSMDKMCYYECFKCKQPYFGGMKACEQLNEDAQAQEFKPEELVCAKCSALTVGAGFKNCAKHGTDFIEFKCKYCCNISQWFCWGNTHFCESCHRRQNNGDYVSRYHRSQLPRCPGPQKCPLKIKHPENGEEFALGCALCRNDQANLKNF